MPVQVNSHVLVRALVFENLYKTVFSVGTEFFFLCGHIWQRWGEGRAVSLWCNRKARGPAGGLRKFSGLTIKM